ncbi:MAG: universal stress protein [Thermofilaceae archaeon]
MFKKILLPTDGSQGVEKAIECAAAIAEKFSAEIHVLSVAEISRVAYGEFFPIELETLTQAFYQNAKEIVNATINKLVALGVSKGKIKGEVRGGYPAEEILRYAKEAEVDLIVMGTHGRRGLKRVLLGSVADEVVHHALAPVMTVRMTE